VCDGGTGIDKGLEPGEVEACPRLDHRLGRQPLPFAWNKTADENLERLASYHLRIPGAGH